MASTPILITLIFFIICQVTNAAFVLPIVKDVKKSQYYTSFQVGTPNATRTYLAISLANKWSWFACDLYNYKPKASTTFRNVPCGSPKCVSYAGPSHFCIGQTSADSCGADAYTPWGDALYSAAIYEDKSSLYKQSQPNSLAQLTTVALPSFPFSCSDKGPLKGLSPYTKGIVTLARVPVSLQSQISSAFKVPRKFSLCLPSVDTLGYNGAMYFGGSPDYLSKSLITTPLIVNPNSTAPIYEMGEASVEYFVKLRSIKVDGTPARFSSSLLSFDKDGVGGTKLSTLDPYTVLQSDIYKALIDVFVAKATAMKMTRVASVAPFGACFSASSVIDTKAGPVVPIIDLIFDNKSPLLHNKNARWRIYGANSMVKVSNSVWCIGFVDGGSKPLTSVVIGGKQMEHTLVEFDIESSMLGVTSSLLRIGKNCANFKGI